jgi:hypothetical protein
MYLSTRPFGIVTVSGERPLLHLYRVDVRRSTHRGPRCLEPPHDCNVSSRFRPRGAVEVDICRPDLSVLVARPAGIANRKSGSEPLDAIVGRLAVALHRAKLSVLARIG